MNPAPWPSATPIRLLVLIFLLGPLLVVASPNADRLFERAEQADDFFISITAGDLDDFSGYRDYFTLLVLTSSDEKHGCKTCPMVQRVTRRISRSWAQYYRHTNDLFFAEIDAVHADNIPLLQEMQIDSIPHVWLIPPNLVEDTAKNAILKERHYVYRLPQSNLEAQIQEMADLIKTHLRRNVILQEEDPIGSFVRMFVATLAALLLFKKKGPKILLNLGKQFVYKVLVVAAILVSITGWHWVRNQNVPFIARNEHNHTIIITGGTHYQFGAEMVIVGANYFALGVSFLLMVYLGQYRATQTSNLSAGARNWLILADCVSLYLLYSCLTSIALRKDHDYPYYFTKLF